MNDASPPWSERVLPAEYEQALTALPRSSWSLIYATKFSILDAATRRYLQPLAQGLAEVTREPLTTGSARYTLTSPVAGELGEVQLYELDDHCTELYIQPPPYPPKRLATPAELAQVEAQPDRAARRRALAALNQRRRADQAAQLRWRQALHAVALSRFLDRLSQERAWIDGSSAPRRTGGRPRKQSNEWAYRQVHELGRARLEVFREWLAMDDNCQLEDSKDSFKKAIRPRPGK